MSVRTLSPSGIKVYLLQFRRLNKVDTLYRTHDTSDRFKGITAVASYRFDVFRKLGDRSLEKALLILCEGTKRVNLRDTFRLNRAISAPAQDSQR
jgi:hypothetical protein